MKSFGRMGAHSANCILYSEANSSRRARAAPHACRSRRSAPSRMTTMRSACSTVDRRCAMTSVVRPRMRRVKRGLNAALGLGVERRSRLVEDQHRRVLEQRTRDRDALALAAREQRAALADPRVEAVRQRRGELRDICRFGGALDVGARPLGERSVGNVVRNRVVEQHDVLAHQRDLPSQIAQAVARARPRRRAARRPRRRRRTAAASLPASTCRCPTGRRAPRFAPAGTARFTLRSTRGLCRVVAERHVAILDVAARTRD